MRAVILGGGISGLASAVALRRALPAANILVVESSPRLGGWLSSSRQDGFLFEYGARGIRPVGNGRAAMRFIETLPGLPERTLVSSPAARTRYMLHNGRVCALPASIPDAIRSPLTSPLVIPGARMAVAAAASAAGLPALASLLAPGAAGSAPFEDLSMHSYLSRTGGAGGVHAAEVLLDAVVSGIFAGDVRALSTEAALAPLGALLRAERQAGGMPALIGGKLRAALAQRLRKLRGSSELTAVEREAADAAAATAALEAADSPFVRECATAASVSFADGMGSLIDAMVAELCDSSDNLSGAAYASMAGSFHCPGGSGLAPRPERACVVDAALLEPQHLQQLVTGILEPAPLVAASSDGTRAGSAVAARRGRTVILTNTRVESVIAASSAAGSAALGRRDGRAASLAVQLSSRPWTDATRSDFVPRSHAVRVIAAAADYVISALPANALAPILDASAAAAIAGVSGASLARFSDSSRSSSSSSSLRDDDESRVASRRHSDASASVHAAACLHGAAGALREIPFASLAVVSLGYKGRNLLPPPHIPGASTSSSSTAAGETAASSSSSKEDKRQERQQAQRHFAGFGYLVPYAERRPAATAQPLPCERSSSGGSQSSPSASAQGRYASASAGVLGMTWDSTVFPGQAQAHADALRTGALPPRRDLASGRVLPGRDVDVAPAVLHGETRVTVMMGGATAPDFMEPSLPHPSPADLDALRASLAAAALPVTAGSSNNSSGSGSSGGSSSPTPAQAAAAMAQSRVDEGFLVYKALRAAAAHVGLPATPDAVCTSVAWSAIPQYTVGHAKRVDRAVSLAQQGFASLCAEQQLADERAAAAHTRFDVIGNSYRGIGVADSLAEALAAGRRAAEVLKRW